MTEFVEARSGVPFQLDGKQCTLTSAGGRLHVDIQDGWSTSRSFGGFVADEWEIVRPYPTNPFSDEIDPDVIAVLVKRPKRYRTAQAARDYIMENDLHEEAGPVGLRALFRSMGGITIQPGGLSDRDAARFPGRNARIHGPSDITLFLADGEDEVRRRELMALTIAVRQLEWERYEEGYDRGPLDLELSDARRTHPEAHLFAAMMLVPEDEAAAAALEIISVDELEEIARGLMVDVCTLQDAHQLWEEITRPEQPKA